MPTAKQATMPDENGPSKKLGFFLKNIIFTAMNFRLIYRFDVSMRIKKEFESEISAMKEINKKRTESPIYRNNYNMQYRSGLFIYNQVRNRKPSIVIETGVANGFSTRLILSAMNRNRKGTLYSTEISGKVGYLLDGVERGRWRLKTGKNRAVFLSAISKLEKVDVFLHDSDHSYENMMFEFENILPKMAKGSIVMSDDVNTNSAFIEFSKKCNAKPKIIPGVRRAFGFFEVN